MPSGGPHPTLSPKGRGMKEPPHLALLPRGGNALLAFVALLLCAMGCTPYSFSGGRTALVATVAVPLFENQTTEFGLAESLTRGVIDGFVQDNQIKVVDQPQAEAVLTGRIVEYRRKAYTFDETDQVKEYIVEIWVTAELTKTTRSEKVWSVERFRAFGTYAAEEEEQIGQTKAISKLAEDLLNRTIKSW